MSADLFCLTDLGACKLKMTKRKFTSDEIEDLLNKSDSEFDADDSVADRDGLAMLRVIKVFQIMKFRKVITWYYLLLFNPLL